MEWGGMDGFDGVSWDAMDGWDGVGWMDGFMDGMNGWI